jgi:hypothetical protein
MPQYSYLQTTPAAVLAIILFVFLILAYLLGHRLRRRRQKEDRPLSNMSTINGMLLGLLGLMLAFSFSMSNERFDTRRTLIIEEANNIGTVVLRTDIFPDSLRGVLRAALRQYLDERIAFYEVGMDIERAAQHYLRADSISGRVWTLVARYARTDDVTVKTSEIVPALNAMIDITTTRRAAGEATLPASIIYFLFLLSMGTAFLLGYEDKGPVDWVMVLGFSVMLSATVFTIIDLDRPRSGIINMDVPHQRMVDVRGLFRP